MHISCHIKLVNKYIVNKGKNKLFSITHIDTFRKKKHIFKSLFCLLKLRQRRFVIGLKVSDIEVLIFLPLIQWMEVTLMKSSRKGNASGFCPLPLFIIYQGMTMAKNY